MKRFLLWAFLCSLFFFSCRTQYSVIENYLVDARDTAIRREILLKEPVIQKNDLLHIQVYSASSDPRLDEPYNLPVSQNRVGSAQGQAGQLSGFLVDQRGNIEYPRIGTLHVEGLTKGEVADLIRSNLRGQLNNPSVIVRFMNFRVTVLGEVGNPGVVTVPSERLTLLEALGMAGDITEFGKKKEVKILREANGRREMGVVDLTSKTVFESPYYQLQQNDVVFVEQTRYKIRRTEQERIAQRLGFALSIITSIALLYNIFR